MAALDVQRRTSPVDDVERPKKKPAPERLSRMRLLKARLRGLPNEEALEPSDALIDKYNSMKEERNLKFVPWDELTRRDEEVRSVKKNKFFDTDNQGRLKLGEEVKEVKEDPADTSTDLKLKSAFQRRGVAMEISQLFSFEAHDKYVNWLFKHLAREPPRGFHPVNVQQVHQIDTEVFIKLAGQTRGA